MPARAHLLDQLRAVAADLFRRAAGVEQLLEQLLYSCVIGHGASLQG